VFVAIAAEDLARLVVASFFGRGQLYLGKRSDEDLSNLKSKQVTKVFL